jgi:hypothetical protein
MPFECHTCKSQTNKLIIPESGEKLVCPNCHVSRQVNGNVRLGQTNDKWVDQKGTKHFISEGKKWEMDNRVISKDDPRVVVNQKTGKETQY